MNGDVATIGRGTVVRGRITGAANLEILGRVEGEVEVDGDVVLDARGLAAASLSGRRVTIRGAVRGDLVATESIVLEDGARVVGDVRAPRVAIATGALVRGYVQTGDAPAASSTARARPAASAATPRAANVSATASAPRTPPRAAPAPVPSPAARPAPSAPARPVATAIAGSHAAPSSNGSQASQPSQTERTPPRAPSAHAPVHAPAAAPKGPPPPVMPALKKGAKGAMSKKRA